MNHSFRYVKLLVMIISAFSFSVSPLVADEGSLEWLTEYHHSDLKHTGFSATFDSNENIVMTGFIEELEATENNRWKMVKVSSDGTLLWHLDLPLTSTSDYTSIATDVNGNIYATSSMTLPGEGSFTHVNKVGLDGNLIWTKVLDDMWRVRDIHSRNDGKVVVTGLGFDSSPYFIVTTLHTDDELNGSILWSTEIDSIDGFSAHHLRFSELDNSNRITLMGVVQNFDDIRVGWVRIHSNGDTDISGIYVNETSSSASFIGNAALSPDGQLYGLLSLDNSFNTVLFAVNEDGEQEWDHEFTQFIHLDNLGSIVFSGNDPILSLMNGNSTLSSYKFNSSGELIWESETRTFLKSLNRNSIMIDAEGALYVSGKDTSVEEPISIIRIDQNGAGEDWSLHFGNTETNGITYNEAGLLKVIEGGLVGASLIEATFDEDYSFATFKVDFLTNSSPESDIDLVPSRFTVDTYPNPFNATLNVKLNLPLKGDLKMRLVNVLGQTVYQSQQIVGNGTHILSVNAEDLTSGMYLLEATDLNGNRVAKRVTLLK